eukprot:466096_1
MGQELNMNEVNELIEEIDEDENGEVDFDEFKVMATKTWFVDAFQSKLVANMTRMMSSMNLLNDDDIDIENELEDEKDSKDEIMNEEYDKLLENMKDKDLMIENMKDKINKLKDENEINKKEMEQKNEIEQLMNEIKGLMGNMKNRLDGMEDINKQKQNDQNIKPMVEKIYNLMTESNFKIINDTKTKHEQLIDEIKDDIMDQHHDIKVPDDNITSEVESDIINDLGNDESKHLDVIMADKLNTSSALLVTDSMLDIGLDLFDELHEELSHEIKDDTIHQHHDNAEIKHDLAKSIDEINDKTLNN